MLPGPDLLTVALAGRLALAEVTSVKDEDGLGQVEVRLWGLTGVPGHTLKVWARVAVPFAGPGRGAFLLPEVGDEVLVGFVEDDPRRPIVLGSLWNGAQRPPERLEGDGRSIDRWSLTSKGGLRIALVEKANEAPVISLTTRKGVTVELADRGDDGELTLHASGSTITIDGEGVRVESGGTVRIEAAQLQVSAGSVQVDTAEASFSGLVQCETLRATSVVGMLYSPGAGNVW